MGTYTYFNYCFILHKVDRLALWALKHMVSEDDKIIDKLPQHPFFDNFRWDIVLSYEGKSEILEQGIAHASGFISSGIYFLYGNSWVKDYDNLIDLFLDWIHPYVKHGVAYSVYDSESENVRQRYPVEKD